MRLLLSAAALTAALTAAGCGGPSSTPGDGSTSTSATPATDRAACRAQLRQGATIADRRRLTSLSLRRFQLRTNDLQEVVEEADHVCPRAVVGPLKAASLRLLTTDEYLLRCAPARTCDPVRLRRRIGAVQRLEHRAEEAFRR